MRWMKLWMAIGVLWTPVEAALQDLLVGSWQTSSIRRYDLDTGAFLGDFVPSGSGGLNVPDGMDWGPEGDLYVSSSGSNRVLRYDGQTGAFKDVFAAGLTQPGNLKFGPDGMLYVCNKGSSQVVRFDPATGDREVFASGAGLVNPVGLLWHNDMMYVSDFTGGAVRRYSALDGSPVDTLLSQSSPLILNKDALGNLLVSTHTGDAVRRFNIDTGALMGNFTNGGAIDCPVGHLFAPDGTMIVASWQNHRLLRYDASGNFLSRFAIGDGLFLPNDLLLTQIPEPAAGLGLGGLLLLVRRRR